MIHDVVVALPPALNDPPAQSSHADPSHFWSAAHVHKVPSPVPVEPPGHAVHPWPFQYSSALHVIHDVVVSAPPRLN